MEEVRKEIDLKSIYSNHNKVTPIKFLKYFWGRVGVGGVGNRNIYSYFTLEDRMERKKPS